MNKSEKRIESKDITVKIVYPDKKERFTSLYALRQELLAGGMAAEKVDMFSYRLFKEGTFISKSGTHYGIVVMQESIINEISPCDSCKITSKSLCATCQHHAPSELNVKNTGK